LPHALRRSGGARDDARVALLPKPSGFGFLPHALRRSGGARDDARVALLPKPSGFGFLPHALRRSGGAADDRRVALLPCFASLSILLTWFVGWLTLIIDFLQQRNEGTGWVPSLVCRMIVGGRPPVAGVIATGTAGPICTRCR